MRSDSSARAVSMMIGMAAVASFARTRRHTSRPSTWGSIRSSTSSSGGRAAIVCSASRPEAARSVMKPALSRYRATSSAMSGSSSTIRMRVGICSCFRFGCRQDSVRRLPIHRASGYTMGHIRTGSASASSWYLSTRSYYAVSAASLTAARLCPALGGGRIRRGTSSSPAQIRANCPPQERSRKFLKPPLHVRFH